MCQWYSSKQNSKICRRIEYDPLRSYGMDKWGNKQKERRHSSPRSKISPRWKVFICSKKVKWAGWWKVVKRRTYSICLPTVICRSYQVMICRYIGLLKELWFLRNRVSTAIDLSNWTNERSFHRLMEIVFELSKYILIMQHSEGNGNYCIHAIIRIYAKTDMARWKYWLLENESKQEEKNSKWVLMN